MARRVDDSAARGEWGWSHEYDLGAMVAAVAKLPPRAHVPELIIKPTSAEFV